jgi:3-(methylthio)propanoyl-CoA dehydrogenase
VLGGFYLFKTAFLAQQDLGAGTGDSRYLKSKIATAQFYAEQVLPLSPGLAQIVQEGGKSVLAADMDKKELL